jgi:ribosomal protein S18 acetylase RimI-like enzyme
LIKELKVGELQIIQDLAQIIWPVSFKDMISGEQIAYMLEWMYNPKKLKENCQNGHIYLLYTENDTPLAFVSYELKMQISTVRIHKLYVHPDCQNMGIGRILLEHVKELVKNTEIIYLDLFVNRNNPAVGFYNSTGFYVAEEINSDIGNGYFMNDYLMKIKF